MTKDEALSAKHEGATTVALKLALEALEQIKQETFHPAKVFDHNHAIIAIREALAQPDVDRRSTESKETFDQQEPVAWIHNHIKGNVIAHRPATLDRHPEHWTALYPEPKPCPTCEALARTVMLDQTSHDTTPPHRKPLTDEEIASIIVEMNGNEPTALFWRDLARAIEAAHGIWPENSDCYGPDWTDRDGEYLK